MYKFRTLYIFLVMLYAFTADFILPKNFFKVCLHLTSVNTILSTTVNSVKNFRWENMLFYQQNRKIICKNDSIIL